MAVYTVPANLDCVAVLDGADKAPARTVRWRTKKETVFAESEIVIDPEGRRGQHGPLSETVGGDWARKGYFGFKKVDVGAVLIVPAAAVVVAEAA